MNVTKGATGTIIALNSVTSVILVLLAIPAFITGMDYLLNDTVTFGMTTAFCCLGIMASNFFILVLSIISIVMSALIASKIKTPWSYRAVYIFFLYPLVLVSFFIANIENGFLTAFIYGFPLFGLGAFLMPFAAIALHRTTSKALEASKVKLICPRCEEQVYTPRFNATFQCPRCQLFYQNPVADLKQFEDAAVARPPEPKKKIPIPKARKRTQKF